MLYGKNKFSLRSALLTGQLRLRRFRDAMPSLLNHYNAASTQTWMEFCHGIRLSKVAGEVVEVSDMGSALYDYSTLIRCP